MSNADRIRQFVLDRYIAPARGAGRNEVIVRAGDVHRAMGLIGSMPAVCSAIGSNKFNKLAHVTLYDRTGPPNGANVYFRFGLSVLSLSEPRRSDSRGPTPRPPPESTANDLDLRKALVLVSCVKSKRPHAAPARDLYTSAWFRKVRDIVEASGARWFILSSYYGLVAPDTEIAPYDHTLNTQGINERRAWAKKVLDTLLPEIGDRRRIVLFAGARYREFPTEPLRRHGLDVDVPMAHLSRGEQLAWLSA